jgi:predicted N-acetyltransferase YhbS
MPELWAANTAGDPFFKREELRVALVDGALAGFVLAKRFRGSDSDCDRYHEVGYVSLLAVAPAFQRRGIGRVLLGEAEGLLRGDGARRVVLGGSFHHFMPGVPDWPAALAFFRSRGYEASKDVYDVRRVLAPADPLPGGQDALEGTPAARFRPFRPGEAAQLLVFLARAFPGRWRRDVAQFLSSGGEIGDVMGLFIDGQPQGFAWLHPPGSLGALRWAGFEPAIAALGPIGVSAQWQGRGLGLALLGEGLRALVGRGARDVVIDWTDLLDFYGKLGFRPWLRYTLEAKELA